METIKKKCEVVILPTKNKSLIWSNKGRRLYYNQNNPNDPNNEIHYHLYITSDDEIKEGDLVYNVLSGIGKVDKIIHSDYIISYKNSHIPVSEDLENINKIIGTTDSSLSQISKREIPQLSKSFVEKYCELGDIDEVMVEYICSDPFCGHTYNEICSDKEYTSKLSSNNTLIISKTKDNWNRKEIIKLCENSWLDGFITGLKEFDPKTRINKSEKDWVKENL